MSTIGPGIPRYIYDEASPPSIVGNLDATGLTVTVRLWMADVEVVLPTSGATEIDGTGSYSYSLGNLPRMETNRQQYHYEFNDGGGNVDYGDFILEAPESDYMPSLWDIASFRHTI